MTPPHAPAEDRHLAQPEVLLVDDDEVSLLLTAVALGERGFRITQAVSGDDALERLATWIPDIIVLDAMMPGRDGFDTCRTLRRMPGFEHVPVLMLTGLEDDASIDHAYEVGATAFLVKAAQWSLLAGLLRHLLRSSRDRIELERSKSKLGRAQDLARMGSFDWRRSGGLMLSPEAVRVLGCLPLEHTTLRTLVRTVRADEQRTFVREMHDKIRHRRVLAADVSIRLLDGRQRIIHVEAEPEFNDHGHGVGYSGIVQDVTERRHAEDEIRQLANFDPLTGLPNRRQLLSRAERALDQARRMQHRMALLLIDLDRFKEINDGLGHAAGDELLVEVGRRLRSCVRHSDQMMEGVLETAGARSHRGLEAVGRLGGDEFVALLPEIADRADAERVAARILQVLRDPIPVGGFERFVTGSVGIAIYPDDGHTVVDLMRNADVAMYWVKAHGKNDAAVYAPHLAGRGREKLELETALHKAIERDEIVLHYQPMVDVRGNRMVGAEALMRWQRGNVLLLPTDFIPLAEETGLILPLSEWALREVARQAKQWQQNFGFADSISVNLSSRVFQRTDLIEHIHQCVTQLGVQHRVIQLEITESNLMQELQNVIPSLLRLNEIGVEIAIDDFGTGYSSLAYLTTLPICELKIDRSFVRDLGVKSESQAVVSAIIALAKALGLRVVAEGVETLRQMEVLHRLGCGVMQGFLFSRALAPDDVSHWLEHTLAARKGAWLQGLTFDADREDDLFSFQRPRWGGR